jgi:hypothetical protein
MTHKSIDALLASTMFLLFVLVTPNFDMIANKIGVIDNANALTVAEIRAARLEALNTAPTATATITPTATITESVSIPTVSTGTTSQASGCTSTTAPWIKVLTPNGSEVYKPGDSVNIAWDKCNTKGQVAYINLGINAMFTSSARAYQFSGEIVVSNTGSATYKLPDSSFFTGDPDLFLGKNFKFMVSTDPETSYGAADTSAEFSIIEPVLEPSVTVITPNGGETLQKGQTYRIKWESKGASDFYVYLLKDGAFYDGSSLSSSSSSNGYFDWTVSTSIPDGSNYKIEVSQGKGDPDQASDQSDASFKITSQSVTNSCANWQVTEGGPQGGIYWEHLRDFSKHPEIDQYQIQWFNGNWSPWYTPTVDDMDTKVNNDGSWRYLISYKQDHNWKTRECISTVKFIDENQAMLTLSKGTPGISLYKRKFIATGDVYIYRAEFLPRAVYKEEGNNILRLYLNGAVIGSFYGYTNNGGIGFDLNGPTKVLQGENTIELIGDLSSYTGGGKFEFDNNFSFIKDPNNENYINAEGLPATGHVTIIEQKKACANWQVTEGGPQGGIYWEHLRDFSKHPEIDQYQIQWFNGNWSPWYTPTVDDMDTKVNNDGSWRYLISYKQDHNWKTRECMDGVVQQKNPSITIITPTGWETYAPGQQINVTWSYKDINDSKTVNMSMLNQSTGESVYIGKATISNKSFTYTIPANVPLGKYKLMTGVLSDDLRWDLAIDWSDGEFTINNLNTSTSCGPNTSPWIKVKNPNGGETYKSSQKVTVKWDSCNIASSQKVEVNLYSGKPTVFGFLASNGTPNDGIEVFTLDSSLPTGSDYEIIVGLPETADFSNSALSISDKSDSKFTINNQTISTSSVTVLSPNGGEKFSNQQIIPMPIKIQSQKIGSLKYYFLDKATNKVYEIGTINDLNPQTISYVYDMKLDLPALKKMNYSIPWNSSSYIVVAEWKSNDGVENLTDSSDNLFTINNSVTKEEKIPEVKPQIKPLITKTSDLSQTTATVTESSGDTVTFARRLVVGKKGDDVMLLQEILIDGGFLKAYSPSGFYGQMTYRGVQKLQRANKIQVTGVVGPATRTLLNSMVEKMDVSGND